MSDFERWYAALEQSVKRTCEDGRGRGHWELCPCTIKRHVDELTGHLAASRERIADLVTDLEGAEIWLGVQSQMLDLRWEDYTAAAARAEAAEAKLAELNIDRRM